METEILKQKIEWVKASKIVVDAAKGTRIHSPQKLKKLVAIIRKSKLMMPLVINNDYTLISGYARLEVSKELGLEEVPVIRISHLTAEELKLFAIADNQLVIDAKWNIPVLKIQLEEIKVEGLDLNLTGLSIPEIDFALYTSKENKNEEEPEIVDFIEENIPKRVKTGQLWQLGAHYLYCGNCLEEESFIRLMGEKQATMVLTDPPYNLAAKSIGGKGKIKHQDFKMCAGKMSEDAVIEFFESFIVLLKKYSVNASLHYLFMDWRNVYTLSKAGKLYSELKNICVWNKLTGGMGSMYRSQHELCFVFQNGEGKYCNNVQLGKYGRNRSNLWNFKGVHVTNPENKDDLKYHPTCKPVKLMKEIVLDASNPGDIVLDCFLGAGSSLLSCEEVGRCCYGIEIEEKYCNVTIERWEQMTGKKAVLINKGGN